jgi:hypothetical protein
VGEEGFAYRGHRGTEGHRVNGQADDRENAIGRLVDQARERAQSPDRDSASMIEAARRRETWLELGTGLSIDVGCVRAAETSALDDGAISELVDGVDETGYFVIPRLIDPGFIDRLRDGVERVRAAGWPPVFVAVFDEFWTVVRTPSFVHLASSLLGDGYRYLPNVWAHYVSSDRQVAGWAPHVDGPYGSERMSIWLPLTEATTRNGCIGLVPKDLMPPSVGDGFLERTTYTSGELQMMLQGSRSLPARPGAIMGWEFGVLHWGSVCQDGEPARVSMAVEIVADGAALAEDEGLARRADEPIPSFEERLEIIGRGLASYGRFEPAMLKYADVAEGLRAG